MRSARDYDALAARWRVVAERTGLRLSVLARAGRYEVYGLRSAEPDSGAAYVSAGVHGDEPAGVWALVEWCEEHPWRLSRGQWLIMPCLNPWGFVRNERRDASGVDLNRSFRSRRHPVIRGWKRFVGRPRFRLAITLHEDFEAQGIYVYQSGQPAVAAARRALSSASKSLRLDPRRVIDHFRAERGVIRVSRRPRHLRGTPEGRYLAASGTPVVMTFETPSEAAIERRVAAHKGFLSGALRQG